MSHISCNALLNSITQNPLESHIAAEVFRIFLCPYFIIKDQFSYFRVIFQARVIWTQSTSAIQNSKVLQLLRFPMIMISVTSFFPDKQKLSLNESLSPLLLSLACCIFQSITASIIFCCLIPPEIHVPVVWGCESSLDQKD